MSAYKYPEKTQQAVKLFQQGQAAQAFALLEKICEKDKHNDLAWFLIASIHFQQGRLQEAEKSFLRAVTIKPSYAEAWNNLGVVRENLKNFEGAAQSYRNALKIKPNYTSALFHMGNLCQQLKKNLQAEELYRKVLKIEPTHIKALNNLALILEKDKHHDEAIDLLKRALSVDSHDIEAMNNIGYVYRSKGDLELAMDFFSRAISLQENSSRSQANLGITQMEMGQFDQALISFEKAIKLDPVNVEAITGMAQLYDQMGDLETAVKTYEKAVRIDNSHVPALNGLGACLTRQGKPVDAQDIFTRANRIDPTYADTRYNLAVSQLAMGLFASGFKNYTARPSRLSLDFPTSIDPLDKYLNDKVVLVHKDQGIGDEIFFLRFMEELKERGARIVYRASKKVYPLVKQVSIIDKVIEEDAESVPKHQFSVSVGDLPLLLGLKDKQTPPPPLRLISKKDLREEAQKILRSFGPPPYIGITWRAGTKQKRVLFKEVSIDAIAGTLKGKTARFVSLQRLPEPGEHQYLESALGAPVLDLSHLNDDLPRMLAILDLLQEYIGVSNTNMHLRASLGKTARVLVPHPPEWRWMISGNSSPWFPGFRIYRQDAQGEWDMALSFLEVDLD